MTSSDAGPCGSDASHLAATAGLLGSGDRPSPCLVALDAACGWPANVGVCVATIRNAPRLHMLAWSGGCGVPQSRILPGGNHVRNARQMPELSQSQMTVLRCLTTDLASRTHATLTSYVVTECCTTQDVRRRHGAPAAHAVMRQDITNARQRVEPFFLRPGPAATLRPPDQQQPNGST